jgi:hypothetical protein
MRRPSIPRLRIATGNDIPAAWGPLRKAKRKMTVDIREANGSEDFATLWGTLTAVSGVDLVIREDSGEKYPIKKTIFATTYEAVDHGRYRKIAISRLVQVPVGAVAVVVSEEGELEVTHPDYVVIGTDNEVYTNSAKWVEGNLEFL